MPLSFEPPQHQSKGHTGNLPQKNATWKPESKHSRCGFVCKGNSQTLVATTPLQICRKEVTSGGSNSENPICCLFERQSPRKCGKVPTAIRPAVSRCFASKKSRKNPASRLATKKPTVSLWRNENDAHVSCPAACGPPSPAAPPKTSRVPSTRGQVAPEQHRNPPPRSSP